MGRLSAPARPRTSGSRSSRLASRRLERGVARSGHAATGRSAPQRGTSRARSRGRAGAARPAASGIQPDSTVVGTLLCRICPPQYEFSSERGDRSNCARPRAAREASRGTGSPPLNASPVVDSGVRSRRCKMPLVLGTQSACRRPSPRCCACARASRAWPRRRRRRVPLRADLRGLDSGVLGCEACPAQGRRRRGVHGERHEHATATARGRAPNVGL